MPLPPSLTSVMPNSVGAGQSEIPMGEAELNQFVNMVRQYMRDYAELNRLIAGEESTNRQIIWAISDAIDDWNSTPPLIGYVSLFSHPSRSLLLRGTVISLLESIGLLQTRNHISFTDGGLTVGVNDKTQFIQSWISLFRSTYEEKKNRLKGALNIENAWEGGVFSEYLWANNFYGEY